MSADHSEPDVVIPQEERPAKFRCGRANQVPQFQPPSIAKAVIYLSILGFIIGYAGTGDRGIDSVLDLMITMAKIWAIGFGVVGAVIGLLIPQKHWTTRFGLGALLSCVLAGVGGGLAVLIGICGGLAVAVDWLTGGWQGGLVSGLVGALVGGVIGLCGCLILNRGKANVKR